MPESDPSLSRWMVFIDFKGRSYRPQRRILVEAADAIAARNDATNRLFMTFWHVSKVEEAPEEFSSSPIPSIWKKTGKGWAKDPNCSL